MAESQVLIQPHAVRYHATRKSDPTQHLAFLFLPLHLDAEEHLSGWVFVADEDNTAGLASGVNWRSQVGKGGPGEDGSWSPFPGDEDATLQWESDNEASGD